MLSRPCKAEFRTDVFTAKEKRWLWVHKDACVFHGPSDTRAYSIPIMPVCDGDCVEVSVNFFNLGAVLAPESLKWLEK